MPIASHTIALVNLGKCEIRICSSSRSSIFLCKHHVQMRNKKSREKQYAHISLFSILPL